VIFNSFFYFCICLVYFLPNGTRQYFTRKKLTPITRSQSILEQ
jgi:hypothetical protein